MALRFTSDQTTFIKVLANLSGLNEHVVAAWVYLEENGAAAEGRQSAGNNDWLNIGYTDTATYGSSNDVWANPTSAATATAGWLDGAWDDPGFGRASAGIQAIVKPAGRTIAGQIAAIQHSGWASSGYPDFTEVYNEVAGAGGVLDTIGNLIQAVNPQHPNAPVTFANALATPVPSDLPRQTDWSGIVHQTGNFLSAHGSKLQTANRVIRQNAVNGPQWKP